MFFSRRHVAPGKPFVSLPLLLGSKQTVGDVSFFLTAKILLLKQRPEFRNGQNH
jgi:hypothetical protein